MGHSLPSYHVTMIPVPQRVMTLESAAQGFPTHLKARGKVTANNSNNAIQRRPQAESWLAN